MWSSGLQPGQPGWQLSQALLGVVSLERKQVLIVIGWGQCLGSGPPRNNLWYVEGTVWNWAIEPQLATCEVLCRLSTIIVSEKANIKGQCRTASPAFSVWFCYNKLCILRLPWRKWNISVIPTTGCLLVNLTCEFLNTFCLTHPSPLFWLMLGLGLNPFMWGILRDYFRLCAQASVCIAGDQTRVGRIQGKHFSPCTLSPVQPWLGFYKQF